MRIPILPSKSDILYTPMRMQILQPQSSSVKRRRYIIANEGEQPWNEFAEAQDMKGVKKFFLALRTHMFDRERNED